MGETCEICGDVGDQDAMRTCYKCRAHEHVYCRKTLCECIPDPDDWCCSTCEMGNVMSPKAVKKYMSIKAGKVKFMPADEAIGLSSRAKKHESLPKSIVHSSFGTSRTAASISPRTPFKSKDVPLKSSSLLVKSIKAEDLWVSGHGSSLMNCIVKKPVSQDSKVISVPEKKVPLPPRKQNIHNEQPKYILVPAGENRRATEIDRKEASKEPWLSSMSTHVRPVISLNKSTSCGNDCTDAESTNFNAMNGGKMNILSECGQFLQGPALNCSWKGSFEIIDTTIHRQFSSGLEAHTTTKVLRKVYEFSKKLPEVLKFEMLPRLDIWTDIFQDDCPDENDIGLYFFSLNDQRSTYYSSLLELIERKDLLMRSLINGVELLVFTSKLLSTNSQRWNENYFLWGVFRHVKKHEAGFQLKGEPLTMSQSSDCVEENNVNGDSLIDMDIDMLAGKDVGSVDMIVSGQSSTSTERYGQEKTSAIPFNRLNVETPAAARKSFTIQKLKKESCDIPPGFEGLFR